MPTGEWLRFAKVQRNPDRADRPIFEIIRRLLRRRGLDDSFGICLAASAVQLPVPLAVAIKARDPLDLLLENRDFLGELLGTGVDRATP